MKIFNVIYWGIFFCLVACVKKECSDPIPIQESNTLSGITTMSTSSKGRFEILLQSRALTKDACIGDYYPNINYGLLNQNYCTAWTYGNTEANGVFFLRFDYNSIPKGARIHSAKISLYADTTNVFVGSPFPSTGHYGVNLSFLIRRVETQWDEILMTYSTRPLISNYNQVIVDGPNSLASSCLDIDVTELVKDQITTHNYGFEISLLNYVRYKRLAFYSSNYPNSLVIPKMVIVYE